MRVSWGPPLSSHPPRRLLCGFGVSGEVGRQGRIYGAQSRPQVSGPSAATTLSLNPLCISGPTWKQPPHAADSHEAISVIWHVVTKPPARSDPSDVTRHLTDYPQLTLVLPAKPQAGLFPQPPSTSKNEKDSLAHCLQLTSLIATCA